MKTRRRRGGAVLGEGGSAFVVYPPPQCENKKNLDQYVARVSKEKRIKNILTKVYPRVLKVLKKIDPHQKYFYYPEPCKVTKITEQNKEDGITKENKGYIELVRKGGQKWFDWRHPEEWKEPTQEQLDHLRKAIDLLHKNRISHGDLHGDNIIYAEDGLPRIIDFTEAVHDAPDDYIKQEQEFVERGWPTLEYYKVYQSDTVEGKDINTQRKEYRKTLLRTRRKQL